MPDDLLTAGAAGAAVGGVVGSTGSGAAGSAGAAGAAGGGAVALPTWMSMLPDEYKKDPEIAKDGPSLGEFIVSYKKNKVQLSKAQFVIPDEKSSEEDRKKFLKALGVPEKADDYKLPADEKYKRVGWDDAAQKQFRTLAMENGLNQKQAESVVKTILDMATTNLDSMVQGIAIARGEGEASLRRKWQAAYDENVTKAGRAFKALATEKLVTRVREVGLGNDPEFIEVWYNIFEKLLGEDSILLGGTGGEKPGVTKEGIPVGPDGIPTRLSYGKSLK